MKPSSSPMITSVQNPKVKAVVQLHQRKYRQERQEILIEGRHPLEEALHANIEILEIYVREGECLPEGGPLPPVIVTEAVMARMATTETPVPVLAVAGQPVFSSERLFEAKNPALLGLVGIQDPGNLGTLIRSACAFGVTGFLLVGPTVDVYHPKVIRASAGLVFRLPWIDLDSMETLRQFLAARPDVPVWGADAHQGISYHQVQYGAQWVLLLGSEAHGLPTETWTFAKPLHIPMASSAESLNVGVAGAIILAEAFQQRYVE